MCANIEPSVMDNETGKDSFKRARKKKACPELPEWCSPSQRETKHSPPHLNLCFNSSLSKERWKKQEKRFYTAGLKRQLNWIVWSRKREDAEFFYCLSESLIYPTCVQGDRHKVKITPRHDRDGNDPFHLHEFTLLPGVSFSFVKTVHIYPDTD